jgi:superfamily II DNA or RNA helicase
LVAEMNAGGSSKWLRFVSELNTLVILDEAHHLKDARWGAEDKGEEGWTRAVAPLVASAHRVLVMTGTPKRSDGAPIAFLDYGRPGGPFEISYTRKEALDERAIIGISVKLCDGHAEYWHRMTRNEQDLSTATGKDEARALRTLLADPAYRNRMLDMAMEEFRVYRSTRYPSARAIVIAENQKQARAISKHLQEKSWRPVLAISEEKDAHHRLAQFRDHGFGDVLITVGMAHEGMDVPQVTHLIALTNVRKSGWLDQALSRATRFDPKSGIPWEQQTAFLYVPNDHRMSSFLREWLIEQDPTPEEAPEARPGIEIPRDSTFKPISGELTDVDYADTYGMYSDEDRDRLRRWDADPSIPDEMKQHPPAIKLKLARRLWPGLEVVK